MKHITLAVTEAVLKHVEISGQKNERQIAILDASAELRLIFDTATKKNRMPVRLCGEFELSVGDNHAIWAAHQTEEIQSEDFNSLYGLLARRPDRPVKFICD